MKLPVGFSHEVVCKVLACRISDCTTTLLRHLVMSILHYKLDVYNNNDNDNDSDND